LSTKPIDNQTEPPNTTVEVTPAVQPGGITGGRRRVLMNVMANWISLAVNMIAGLVLIRIATDGLGQVGYGVWGLIGGVLRYLSVGVLSLSHAVPKFVAGYHARREFNLSADVVNTAASLMLALTCIVVPVMAVLGYFAPGFVPTIPSGLARPVIFSAALMGANFGLSYVARAYLGAIQGTQHYVIPAIVRSTWCIIRVVFVWAVFNWYHAGLETYAAGQLTATIVFLLMAAIALRRMLPEIKIRVAHISRAVLPRLGKFLAAMSALTVVNILSEASIPFIIAKFFGVGTVASYTIAKALAYTAKSILPEMTRILVPMSSSLQTNPQGRALLATLLTKATRYCVLLSGALAVVLVAYGGQLLQVFAPNIDGAFPFLVVIGLTGWATWSTSAAISTLVGMGCIRAITIAQTVAAAGGLLLAIVLALVTDWPAVTIVTVIFVCIAVKDLFWLPFYAAFRAKAPTAAYLGNAYARPLLAVILLALFAYLGQRFVPCDSLQRLVWHLATMLMVFALLALAIVVERDDRSALVAFVKRKFNRPRS